MTPLRVFLVDDHRSVVEGFAMSFSTYDDITVVGTETHPTTAVETILRRRDEIDLVVTDYQMEPMDGIALSKAIKADCPDTKTMLLTMFSLFELSEKAMRNGLDGYAPKAAGLDEIVTVMRDIRHGRFVTLQRPDSRPPAERKQRNPHITATEMKVICCIVKLELTSKEIANKLFISEDTVESHRKNIMSKLGVRNVVGIANYAYSIGISRDGGEDCPCTASLGINAH